MGRKRFTAEQIISKLREAEILLAKGQNVGQVSRALGITEQTYYRWRKEYGGLKVTQAKRLKVLDPPRSSQGYQVKVQGDEEHLRAEIIKLACKYGRYGYRRITALLIKRRLAGESQACGAHLAPGGAERATKAAQARQAVAYGSCVRLRPTHRNHVWSYDFVSGRTYDGCPLKLLTIIDGFKRESLDILTRRKINSNDVIHCLAGLFLIREVPDYIRSDNGT